MNARNSEPTPRPVPAGGASGFALALLLLGSTVAVGARPTQAQDHDHARMHAAMHGADASSASELTAGGEAIFEALAEAVALLEGDPSTDWSRVDLDALRAHLLDMNALFQRATVETEEIPGGARFRVSGAPDVMAAAGRMVPAHSKMLERERGWTASVDTADASLVLEVRGADDAAAAHVRGLGFFGLMASGEHHRAHHLAMARGHGHP